MYLTTSTRKGILAITIPVALQIISVLLVRSVWFTSQPNSLALAVSIDFLFTAPFVYWLLIRKTRIPNTTVLPFFILSTVLASFVIPSEHQSFLNDVKTWFIPILEIGVISFVVSRVYLIFKAFKKSNKNKPDFLLTLGKSCEQILPKKAAALLANEIAILYYAIFKWKKHLPSQNEFTYHQKSGSISLLGAIIFVVVIETVAFHFVIEKWSIIAAWIATALSIYSGFFVFGIIKSIPRRLITIEAEQLFIPYGLFGHAIIPLQNISAIKTGKIIPQDDEKLIGVSPLLHTESPNVSIETHEPIIVNGIYGTTKKTKELVFSVDDLGGFKELLEQRLQELNITIA